MKINTQKNDLLLYKTDDSYLRSGNTLFVVSSDGTSISVWFTLGWIQCQGGSKLDFDYSNLN